jgi:hypothetical protein
MKNKTSINNETNNTDVTENNDATNEAKDTIEPVVVESENQIIALHELLIERLTVWSVHYDFNKLF